MEAGQLGTHRSGCQKPTNQLLPHGLRLLGEVQSVGATRVGLPVFRMTSGARYSGVPQSVYVSPATGLVQLYTYTKITP